MKWMELSVLADAKDVPNIDPIMARYGHGGTVIEQVQSCQILPQFLIKAYLPNSRAYKAQRLQLEQELTASGKEATILKERRLEPDQWLDSLKSHFSTVEIGDWLMVKPSWASEARNASGRLVIELDPGAAFGTGLHPTTRLCLIGLNEYLKPSMTVLDLGTGTGIISIAAAKLGAAEVLALDIDPVAVSSTKSNLAVNCVSNGVLVRRGTLSGRAQANYKDHFDLVIANITARTISELSRAFHKVVKSGGKLIVSGIHDEGLDEVLISLALTDFKLEKTESEEGWHVVVATKL